jgi:putative lipoic acid-binding regulatory protein
LLNYLCTMSEDKARLDKLRVQLNEFHQWPSIYMFKFVIPTDEKKIIQLHTLFGESAEIRSKLSGKGNYTSMTIRSMMLNADAVFDKYIEASKIEGIISL